ncbi:MAG: L-rhamnose/proton symporter RhaT [Candidatus Acidiferrales bacterium]
MPDTSLGLLLLVVAGVMNASFTLPMKYTRRWAWENTWLAWTIFALLIFPPVAAWLTLPQLASVYHATGASRVWIVAAFGAGWGVSQVLFGLAAESIGIALTFSIVLGISAGVGSVIPMIRNHPEKIFSTVGAGLFAGVALIAIGVGFCAVAGRHREASLRSASSAPGSSMARGLVMAIICGFGACFVNLGLDSGKPLLEAAEKFGASHVWSANAAWLPLMVAGALPNLVYCFYLLAKNKTRSRFGSSRTVSHWLMALLMAIFWFGSTSLYGVSAGKLGSWGTTLGWPLFMSLIVITASLLGILTGEWRNTGTKPLRVQLTGVAVLVLAVFVLAAASRSI